MSNLMNVIVGNVGISVMMQSLVLVGHVFVRLVRRLVQVNVSSYKMILKIAVVMVMRVLKIMSVRMVFVRHHVLDRPLKIVLEDVLM